MLKKQVTLILFSLLLTACNLVPASPTSSLSALSTPLNSLPPTATILGIPSATSTLAPTKEVISSITATPTSTRTITNLGAEARSVSFADKEPWLGALVDSYENGRAVGQAVLIFDYLTGAQIRIIRGVAETGSESPLVFRPGSTVFLTGSSSGVTRMWDAATGEAVGDFTGPSDDWPSTLAFSVHGKILAAGFSKEVRIWNAASRQLLDTITPTIPPVRIISLAFSPDGQSLAIGTESGALILWDAGKKQQKIISYSRVDSMAFSPDGKLLATAALGSETMLWDTSRWVQRATLNDATTRGAAANLTFSPDGKSLVVSSGGDSIQVWDVMRLVKTHILTVDASYIGCIALAPDGHTLATGLSDRTLVLWNLLEVGAVRPGTPAPTAVPNNLVYVFPQPLEPGRQLAVNDVKMFSEQAGWGFALDGPRMSLSKKHLLHTINGGQTWREAVLPESSEPGGFFALDADTAWTAPTFHYRVDENNAVIPYKTLFTWRTSDGGQIWQQSQPFSLTPKWAQNGSGVNDYSVQMQFLDRSNGWMLVNVDSPTTQGRQWQLYKTGDGGMNWQRVNESDPFTPTPNEYNPLIFLIAFWDDASGWSAGSLIGIISSPDWNAGLSITSDGGRTWDFLPIPAPADLPEDFKNNEIDCGATSVERITAEAAAVRTECVIYKTDSYPRYFFYHLTPDQGKTWYTWQTNGTEDFISATKGWRLVSLDAEQITTIQQTSDSGATWNEIGRVPWSGSLNFVSDQVGWAIAKQEEACALLKTTDGGKTWLEVKAVLGK